MMSEPNLTPEERTALAQLLRRTIDADRVPLLPRLKPLKSALAKLDPPQSAEPYPAPVAWVNSTIGQRKGRGRR